MYPPRAPRKKGLTPPALLRETNGFHKPIDESTLHLQTPPAISGETSTPIVSI